MRYLLALAILSLAASPAKAERFVQCGEYRIHYTTLSSMLIPNDIAEAHGIVRSQNRLLTNVTIVRNGHPVHGHVEGTVMNLLNQMTSLDFREITEQDAVYYLAGHVVDEKDTLRFNLTVKPEGQSGTCPLKFMRTWQT